MKKTIIKCSSCSQYWHTTCVGLDNITKVACEKLTRWKCVLCAVIQSSIKEKLARSLNCSTNETNTVVVQLQKMEENLLAKIEETKKINNKKSPFLEAAVKSIEKSVNETNKQVRNQAKLSKSDNTHTERNDACTRVVTGPKDINIRNSKDLRKKFNEYYPKETYPNILINHAIITAGGSFIFEFTDEESANTVEENWKKEYFGGNFGMIKYNSKNRTGIVKHVYDIDEVEIEEEIQLNYPSISNYDLFKKDGEFTGMIKVTFKNAEDLENAIHNKFIISHRKYQIEEFKHRPKVIKCNICQAFGHVARRCRNQEKLKCGKCSEPGHQTKDCEADEENFKCCHCESSEHITGSYKCPKVQERFQILSDRKNYG